MITDKKIDSYKYIERDISDSHGNRIVDRTFLKKLNEDIQTQPVRRYAVGLEVKGMCPTHIYIDAHSEDEAIYKWAEIFKYQDSGLSLLNKTYCGCNILVNDPKLLKGIDRTDKDVVTLMEGQLQRTVNQDDPEEYSIELRDYYGALIYTSTAYGVSFEEALVLWRLKNSERVIELDLGRHQCTILEYTDGDIIATGYMFEEQVLRRPPIGLPVDYKFHCEKTVKPLKGVI